MAVHVPKADEVGGGSDDPMGMDQGGPSVTEDLPGLESGAGAAAAGEAPGSRFARPRGPKKPETIGALALVVRGIGSVMCLAISVLMISNGNTLMSVWPYIITVSYAGAAIWGLTSVTQKITVKQFAIEMVALVAVTLVLRTASPEMFAVEPEEQVQKNVAAEPQLPNTPIGRFVGLSLDVLNGTLALVDARAASPEEWKGMVQAVDYKGLNQIHTSLSSEDKIRVNGIWKHVSLFAPKLLDEAIKSMREDEQGRFYMLPSSEVLTGRKKLVGAQRRAELLRATLLVWPDELAEE